MRIAPPHSAPKEPKSSLADVAPPPGDYQCRTIKIGSALGLLAYVAYPSFRCRIRIDGDHVDFLKLTGSQRPIGQLYPDQPPPMVVLVTLHHVISDGWSIGVLVREIAALYAAFHAGEGADAAGLPPLPADDPKRRKPDIARAREHLGWQPRVPLEEGLTRTIEYFREIVQQMKVR